MKIEKKPNVMFLTPLPVVLLSCGDNKKDNIITLAAVGVACIKPPIVSVAITLHKFSHKLIEEKKEFVVNVPSREILDSVDLNGVISGRDFDKFKESNLTREPAKYVKAPMIQECKINLECKLVNQLHLGLHDLFLGEVVGVHIDESIVTENERIDLVKMNPITYSKGEYWAIGKKIKDGRFSKKNFNMEK
ncbi:MAG: flavin reductase family protein [Candidatus Ranarchaeia archaeon]